MKCIPEPRKNGTVIILGAGASRGAKIKDPPPTLNAFINAGMSMKLKEDYSRIWALLEKMGVSLSELKSGEPNLEDVYSLLYIMSSGLWYVSDHDLIEDLGQSFDRIPPVYFLESFIVEVLSSASLRALKATCEYHDKVVRSLKSGDSIISFNYDLIADSSVKRFRKWSEMGGYGFLNYEQLTYNEKRDKLIDVPCDISLFKPHGSLNWVPRVQHPWYPLPTKKPGFSVPIEIKTLQDRLTQKGQPSMTHIRAIFLNEATEWLKGSLGGAKYARVYEELASSNIKHRELFEPTGLETPPYFGKPFILPPTIYKLGTNIIPEELAKVWSGMRKAISLAGKIVIIGVSFKAYDLEFNSLLRWSLLNKQSKHPMVEIVDPDALTVDRLKAKVPGIEAERIADTIKEYAERL
jgi:hypothetical protein